MKRTLLAANLMLSAAFLAAAQKTPESMLGAALHQEEVQGDLKGAIAAYQKVVAAPGVSRKTAADALVRMGQCYEKLGDAESRKAYERVLREYADQKEAAVEAQTRLASLRRLPASNVISYRQAWAGPKVDTEGTVSPDGRYLSFPDWETGDLALHDLVTGTDRRLTSDGTTSKYAERSAISRDSKLVAFARFDGKDRYALWLVDLQKGTAAPPRRLYDNEDVDWLAPYDWSPDGKRIAVQISRKDRTAFIGLISSADGSLTVLKSVDWRGTGRIAFSPDGKFLAYDLPVSESSRQRDVYVLAVDGSRETPAVVHPATDMVVGWSPDGSLLLFSSDRTGSVGLWSVAISEGKPQGAAKPIKPDGFGRGESMGLTASGALYFGSKVAGMDVQIASLDFATGQLLSPPVNPIPDYLGSNMMPNWSPDGKFLAYRSRRDMGTRNTLIAILSLETGQVRELRSELGYANVPRWSPDGRFIAVNGSDLKGRQGLFRIDVQSGAVSPIALSGPGDSIDGQDWSPDGKKVYYRRLSDPGHRALFERDLASGEEHEIIGSRNMSAGNLSPDGRWIAARSKDESTGSNTLIILPVSGGHPREIFRTQNSLLFPSWAPDSSSIIIPQAVNNRLEHWRVPLAGGEPIKLNVNLGDYRVSVHPDGRQVAYSTGENRYEVWVLENFLPAASVKK